MLISYENELEYLIEEGLMDDLDNDEESIVTKLIQYTTGEVK